MNLLRRKNLHIPFIIALGLLVIFSCSKNKDMRDSVVKNYGEPDMIEEGGYGTYQWMRYIFAKRSINRVYEFQKSASGCGGSGEWYIYRFGYADYLNMYPLYSEASFSHSPVISAPSGDVLILEAPLSDPDNLVLEFDLYYRTPGASDFIKNSMSPKDNNYTVYFASISGEEMTAAGIEYYIEMNYYVPYYEKLYTQRLPETGVYTIEVSGASGKTVTGAPQSTLKPVHHLEDEAAGGAYPVSP